MAKFEVFKPVGSTSTKDNTPVTQQKEYTLSWGEWASKNKKQIVICGSSSPLYTVPKGYNLFITSAFLTVGTAGVGAGLSPTAIFYTGQGGTILSMTNLGTNQTTSVSNSFPMPIKVSENDYLGSVDYSANTEHTSGFTGFLEEKTL